jgi:hypothetical protein
VLHKLEFVGQAVQCVELLVHLLEQVGLSHYEVFVGVQIVYVVVDLHQQRLLFLVGGQQRGVVVYECVLKVGREYGAGFGEEGALVGDLFVLVHAFGLRNHCLDN